jgi:UDP-3-O-[3-hydroxymyristoyl] glucosamine N-acyltransferase
MTTHSNDERLNFAKNNQTFRPYNNIHWSAQIGKNSVIGADGFGYARDEDGTLVKMPHQGNVVIEENVEIGSNTCIDRAVRGSTVIGSGTKIDNLVHIAHGVKIGKNCLIVAGAVIGGSCEIGDNCYIGIGAMIKNKIKIGKNAVIGMGAVVLRDVPEGATIIGNPGKELIKP